MTATVRDILTNVATKGDIAPVAVGDSTNLPASYSAFQESLWETLTFQRNIPMPRAADEVGLSLAIQCADVKARDIAKSDMVLWRKDRRRWTEVEPGEHWLAKRLARKPNEVHSWTEFWRMVVLHLDLAQNAYILKDIDRLGNVQGLIPMPSARVRPRVSDSGKLFYEFGAGNAFERGQLRGETIILPADRVIHLRGRMMDGFMGLSNLALGSPIFDLLGAISAFQQQLFANDGRQPIVFESKDASFGAGAQGDAAFQRLKNQLTERVRKMRVNGDPILLEAGYQAKVIAQNAREAMTSEAFNATVMRVCGVMQTPPHKIFAYETVKYENMSAADNQYANDCLIPIAKNIEEKFRNDLLDEETEWDVFYPEFDRMPMLAGDPKTLSDVLDKAVKNGGIEIDEYRERLPLNLNPLPNDSGQVRYVPVAMAMIDRDGNVIQAATGQNPGAGTEDPAAAPTPSGERGLRLVSTN